MIKLISDSTEKTEEIGAKIASLLNGNEIIALYGGLGAGKTSFTRGLSFGLSITQGVSSPTFAIINEYQGKFTVYHFDMYRIETIDDLYATGFFDYIDTGVIVIEWSENIESILPPDCKKIRINSGAEETQRILEIEGFDDYEDIIR